MKAKVTVKIKNNPVTPLKEFTTTLLIEFDQPGNVISRGLRIRQELKELYGPNVEYELLDVVCLN